MVKNHAASAGDGFDRSGKPQHYPATTEPGLRAISCNSALQPLLEPVLCNEKPTHPNWSSPLALTKTSEGRKEKKEGVDSRCVTMVIVFSFFSLRVFTFQKYILKYVEVT